jgi:SAM-dependent methyltransferase
MDEPYVRFAEIYDRVMREVGYEMWADYVQKLLVRFRPGARTLLDLACGTGSSTLPFARRGMNVAGVDRSPAMLERARAKAAAEGLAIPFYQQDLCRLSLKDRFDAATCLYDSINYLLSWDDLCEAFARVGDALEDGGVFIFDINTAYKLSAIHDTTMFIEEDDVSLVWENTYDRRTRIWRITLTGFIRTADGHYERFREVHEEKAHTIEELTEALGRAGFEVGGVYTAFTFEPPRDDASRVYVVAIKTRRPAA